MSYLTNRARQIEGTRPQPRTTIEWEQTLKDRKNARILAESIRRQKEIGELTSAPLPSANLDPTELLSTEELLALDQQKRREAHITEQTKRTLQATGTWLLRSHPEFPATEEAGAKLNE